MTGARWISGSSHTTLRRALVVAGLAACQACLAQVEGFSSSQRVDITLMPEATSSVGIALGVRGMPQSPAPGLASGAPPTVDVGLHWRHTLDSSRRIGVTAFRTLPQASSDPIALADRGPAYGARVELDLNKGKPEKAAFADKGLVGVQLDNGGRISLRRKHGGPMIYYRNTF